MSKIMQPYGTWDSPISIANMTGDQRLSDVKWDTSGHTLIWHERRASGHALVVQTDGTNPHDLLRDDRIGGGLLFGGGGFTVNNGIVYFVGESGRIYRVPISGGIPRPITPAYGSAAAPATSPDGEWLVYVHSYEDKDALLIVPTDGSDYPHKLLGNVDFIMQPTWHPNGKRIACITWNHPHMPWDASQLRMLHLVFDPEPHVIAHQIIAGAEDNMSVFGAEFSPNGNYLAYTSDEKGWCQLYIYALEEKHHFQITVDEAEYGVPAWLQDMRTFAWSKNSQSIYALRNKDSKFTLQHITIKEHKLKYITALAQYTHLEQIAVSPQTDEIALIAGSSTIPNRIVTVKPEQSTVYVRAYSSTESISTDYLSAASDVSWETDNGTVVHGLYYAPTNPRFESKGLPPLILYIHSGPTRQRFSHYFPEPQFFASRGFAVLEPNYRGSTGYGKAFKDMLNGTWGMAEVEDCARGANHLVSLGLADPKKIIVMGESSGGFSVLQSLIHKPELYCAGVCQAPVTDQFALVMDTHKFERHYTQSLIGDLPEAAQTYRDRSPVFHANKIQVPVAIFHGTHDTVVPASQSEAVVSAIRRNGVSHVFKLYEGEGHSFRKTETLTDYYQTVMKFLLQHVIYA